MSVWGTVTHPRTSTRSPECGCTETARSSSSDQYLTEGKEDMTEDDLYDELFWLMERFGIGGGAADGLIDVLDSVGLIDHLEDDR